MAEVETYYVHPNWAWQKGKPSERWIDERCIGFVKKSDHDAALRRAKGEGMEELEQKYRKELWLNHGHHGLYGDDGEMQCIECHQYGATDYKRDPLEKVERATFLARMARAAQIEEGSK